MKVEISDRTTARNLGLDLVLEAVKVRASSAPGRAIVLGLWPGSNRDLLTARRAAVAELMVLLGATTGGPRLPAGLDLGVLDDVQPLLERLGLDGVLDGGQINKVASIIAPSLALARLVFRHPDRLPALASMVAENGVTDGSRLEALECAGAEVDAALDEQGGVKDSASPELRRLRRRASDLRTHLSGRARKLVEKHAEHLHDQFYTLREDRYVLPVRSDSRAQVAGIIHGTSNSGATLFIEPSVLVDDCNELKVLEGEVQAAQAQVLEDLSASLARESGLLTRLHGLLVQLDVLLAMARFGVDIHGTLPVLVDDPVLDLKKVKHPLLVLAGLAVVGNDVRLGGGMAWVVSGPNAGGKTVLLKAVGLTVLMSAMGLPVAADDGTVVGTFDHVRAEIGDAQSIEMNLSTFSAQVESLGRILEQVGSRSLVLLDELAAGTDPGEGAALAEAIVLELLERRATILVATHFAALKRLSIGTDGLVAAGMGLDLETLEPTFLVHVGVPGSSGGLLVAERFGLPRKVITRAREILETGTHPGEESRMAVLERLRADLERRLAEADGLASRLRSREVKLEKREQELTDGTRRSLMAEQRYLTTELTVLRGELKHAHRVLRRRPVQAPLVEAGESVASRVGRVLAPDGSVAQTLRPHRETRPLEDEPLRPGERVLVPSLGLEGEVVKVLGRTVRIDRAGVSWNVELERVARPVGSATSQEKTMDETPTTPGQDDEEQGQSSYNTLDLRGRGVDEAQIDLDAFIDDALELGLEQIFVIHGHGTGVLKNGLRRYIRHLKKVESFRPGKREEGGDGVTVLKLRSQ